ncbi:MAG: sugar transferase, partial [Pseudomonadales bacterium]|nr:sugar transferase [Pseudomonadales bacterium]
LRAWMPLILLVFFTGTLVLSAQSGFFASLALLQVLAYSLAALKQLLPNLKWPKPIQLLHYLVSGHVSNGIGSLYYFCNRKSGAPWSRVKASSGAQHYIPVSILFSKRLVDFCLASLGVLITLPVWLLIGLAIKLESRGPVFFRQMRVGRILPDRAELFMMIKFRTMVQDAEKETGAVWAQDRDPRITRVGWFLRKTRLDELPQLLNVIKGEMSLIGPRPERPGIGGRLDAAIPYYAERTCFVSPGITGFAQVHQGYDTCLDDVKSKLLYDHAYAIALSRFRAWLLMDLMVIYKTLLVMVLGKGR